MSTSKNIIIRNRDDVAQFHRPGVFNQGDVVILPPDEFGRRLIKIVPDSLRAARMVSIHHNHLEIEHYYGKIPKKGYIVDPDYVKKEIREVEYDERIDQATQKVFRTIAKDDETLNKGVPLLTTDSNTALMEVRDYSFNRVIERLKAQQKVLNAPGKMESFHYDQSALLQDGLKDTRWSKIKRWLAKLLF